MMKVKYHVKRPCLGETPQLWEGGGTGGYSPAEELHKELVSCEEVQEPCSLTGKSNSLDQNQNHYLSSSCQNHSLFKLLLNVNFNQANCTQCYNQKFSRDLMEQHIQCSETIILGTKHPLQRVPGHYGHLAVWDTLGQSFFQLAYWKQKQVGVFSLTEQVILLNGKIVRFCNVIICRTEMFSR